jgi:hypothetical protein
MATSAPCVPSSFSCTLPTITPRDGALILSEVRVPALSVVCDPCGRRERYDVERLMRRYGWEAKLTDLLARLTADCPKRGSASVYNMLWIAETGRAAFGSYFPNIYRLNHLSDHQELVRDRTDLRTNPLRNRLDRVGEARRVGTPAGSMRPPDPLGAAPTSAYRESGTPSSARSAEPIGESCFARADRRHGSTRNGRSL